MSEIMVMLAYMEARFNLLANAKAGKNFVQNFIIDLQTGDFAETIQGFAQIKSGEFQ
jgi:hypothetical protein